MQSADVRFHLDPDLLASTAEGRHNFLNRIKGVCEAAGLHVTLVPNDERTRRAVAERPAGTPLERDEISFDRHPALSSSSLCRMIFPENRFPLFGIML